MPVSRHQSSTTVKLEEEENRNELASPIETPVHGMDFFRVKRLQGSKPIYFRPEAQFLDAENETVYFYWQRIDPGPFRLSALSLRTGIWKEMVRILLQNTPCTIELVCSCST